MRDEESFERYVRGQEKRGAWNIEKDKVSSQVTGESNRYGVTSLLYLC